MGKHFLDPCLEGGLIDIGSEGVFFSPLNHTFLITLLREASNKTAMVALYGE